MHFTNKIWKKYQKKSKMIFPGEIKKQDNKNGDELTQHIPAHMACIQNDKNCIEFIPHIPAHIAFTQDCKNGNEFIQHNPAHITFMELDRNTIYNEKVMKIIPDVRVKDSIISSSEVLHIEQATTQPVVLICVNMAQNREIMIISVGNKTELNEYTYPTGSPESQLNIYQLLQNVEIMCRSSKQRLPQQAITQGNSTSASNDYLKSPKIIEIPSTRASICERSVPALNNDVKTQHTHKTCPEASENLSRPISSENQMTICFHIYNKIFTEFLNTIAVMYCTLTNKFLTKHKKNLPCLCSHDWYFRNFTQGYVLKCILKNVKINVLYVKRNLYFIIITKFTSNTKIDIFFKFQDGIFTVDSDSQECRFAQHILLKKDSEMDKTSSFNANDNSHVSHSLVLVQTESEENSDLSTTVSSSLSLPEYPSQTTFYEEEINTWPLCIGEPDKERQNKKVSFEYPLEIFVNMWRGIKELTGSLRQFNNSTHKMVYNQLGCTASVLNWFDIFNEELFEVTTIDPIFKRSSKQFSWEQICKPLLHTLAYTMFSSVL